MSSTTAAGTKWHFSAGVPATQDAAGYAALTYTQVKGVENLGPIGPTYAEVTFQPLDGAKETHKGSPDFGSLSPNMAHDDADAGQSLVRASVASNALYANKVVYPSGEIRYFQTRTFGYPENVDGADTIITAKPMLKINTAIVKVPAP